MPNFVTILPSIHQPWTSRCIEHMSTEFLNSLVVIDNTGANRGVAASWNLGIDQMMTRGSDWLVLLSAAIRFNADFGGRDFLQLLDLAADESIAVEAGHGMGWHLIAFRRQAFEMVGRFDENFFPAYFEDNDFGRRLYVATGMRAPMWEKVGVEVSLQGFSHGVDLGGADTKPELMIAYYQEKWGGMPGQEIYPDPFGDVRNQLSYWPAPCSTCHHPRLAHRLSLTDGAACGHCGCRDFTKGTVAT